MSDLPTKPAAPRMLDVVALITDRPDVGLSRGQVGTVVEDWGDGTFEVEFIDPAGTTYALATFSAAHLMVLRYTPLKAA
ncbi:MAG: DUF4926 domain-containing protein [Phycisphaeraceae bacterium]|nr:DUF4926 domain-containing protein [Phycisphaeraceae bacterium]